MMSPYDTGETPESLLLGNCNIMQRLYDINFIEFLSSMCSFILKITLTVDSCISNSLLLCRNTWQQQLKEVEVCSGL